jgi:hypothetical protein
VHGGADLRPAPRAPKQNLLPVPRAPVRPRPNGQAGSSSSSVPRPTLPRSPGLQAAPLTRPGPAVAVRAASSTTAWLQLQVPGWLGRCPARSALCLPSCPSLSCLSAASCASKQLLLLALITCCACHTMCSAQIIHNPTCHNTCIDIMAF